jgi:hypothetical protein
MYTNDDGDDGWSLEDYDDATYYLAIELAVPLEHEVEAGEYPQYNNWSLPENDENMSYIYLESGEGNDYFEYYTEDIDENHEPVVVTGGVDDGDKMTVKFSGRLTYYYYNGTNWVENSVSGKFYFSGRVQDMRPI